MVMKCPRCVQKIHRAADACPHCGFTLADADRWFGGRDLDLRSLADTAGLLRHDERARVEEALDHFRSRFPQLFAAIYTDALGGTAALRPFGFWLLNRAKFRGVPPDTAKAAGILLTIDPQSKVAGLTFGYLLDPFLEESDAFECLARAHSHWLEGRYADGMLKAIDQLIRVLRKRSRQAMRNPARFERKVKPPVPATDWGQHARDDSIPADDSLTIEAREGEQ